MKLLASPEPLSEESRSSWIQRICGAHDYSMKRLCRSVGIDSTRVDWDFGVDDDSWKRVILNSGRSGESFEHGASDWALLCDLHCGSIKPWYVNGKPSSKWCPICLAADSTPHLRWYWRIESLHTCPYHDVALSTACPWCHNSANLSVAGLVPWGPLTGTANLAGCASCGMPFLAPGDSEATLPRGSGAMHRAFTDPVHTLRSVLNQRALAAWGGGVRRSNPQQSHLLEAVSRRQSQLHHYSWVPDRSQKRGADLIQTFSTPRPFRLLTTNSHWSKSEKYEAFKSMLRGCRDRPFNVNLQPFVTRSQISRKLTCREHFWSPEESDHWSSDMNQYYRIRLAKALLIIRKERARHRSRALQGLTVMHEQLQIDANAELYEWGTRVD